MAHLVWLQLDLFDHSSALNCQTAPVEDLARDRRTGGQWLRAVRSYLDFMSGSSWRRHNDHTGLDYLWYVDGIRTLNGIGVHDEPSSRIAPVSAKPDSRIAALALRPRGELVAELLQTNPKLTCPKILLHLQTTKLATMLCAARDSQGQSSQERVA